MARFNRTKSPTVTRMASRTGLATMPTTRNRAGGEAFEKSPKLDLVGRLLANFLQNTFYESANTQLGELVQVAHKVADPLFLAKASVYARNVFGMRSVTHVVAAVVAKMIRDANEKKGNRPALGMPWFKRYFDKVVARPDDMVEIMSYFLSHYKKPIPNSLKKGFADAFGRFDRYQLAKYRCEGKELTLRKLAKLVWPTITDKNRDAIADLWAGTLTSQGSTWESGLTQAGKAENKTEAKADVWKNMVLEEKIGQFALLRNLRNILDQAPEVIGKACQLLTQPSRIKDSKILPFRYYTAYKEVSDSKVRKALQDAFNLALSNIPKLEGSTLVAVDVSGSMNGQPIEIGSLFAGALVKSQPIDLVVFQSHAKEMNTGGYKDAFEVAEAIQRLSRGGTNFHAVYELLMQQRKAYDRIIFLSDGEAWMGYEAAQVSLDAYDKAKGTKTKMYFFDLAGHNTLQWKESRLFYVPGFSEKVFDLMALMERGIGDVLTEIEAIQI